jgi:hypothetical protein
MQEGDDVQVEVRCHAVAGVPRHVGAGATGHVRVLEVSELAAALLHEHLVPDVSTLGLEIEGVAEGFEEVDRRAMDPVVVADPCVPEARVVGEDVRRVRVRSDVLLRGGALADFFGRELGSHRVLHAQVLSSTRAEESGRALEPISGVSPNLPVPVERRLVLFGSAEEPARRIRDGFDLLVRDAVVLHVEEAGLRDRLPQRTERSRARARAFGAAQRGEVEHGHAVGRVGLRVPRHAIQPARGEVPVLVHVLLRLDSHLEPPFPIGRRSARRCRRSAIRYRGAGPGTRRRRSSARA